MRHKSNFVCLGIVSLVILAGPSLGHCGQPKRSTDDLGTVLQKAQTLIRQQKFKEAEPILRRATKRFDDQMAPWYLLAYAVHNQQRYDDALKLYEKTIAFPQGHPIACYNMACIYAIQKKADQAFASLDKAIQSGFSNFAHLQNDPDFEQLRKDPRFQNLLPKQPDADDLFVEPTQIIHQWNGV